MQNTHLEWGSYLSAEMQSVYSPAPADWAVKEAMSILIKDQFVKPPKWLKSNFYYVKE